MLYSTLHQHSSINSAATEAQQKGFPMLNWKKRSRDARDQVNDSVDDVKSYLGGIWFSRTVLTVVALYLIITIIVGWYWSQEPESFSVQEHTQQAAEKAQRPLVTGYTTVETLKQVASTLLDKPGGYLTNDIAPPGIWLDNMPSWEYGALVQVRDLSRALRKDFARSQSQSTEDADLAKAEPLFNFDNKYCAEQFKPLTINILTNQFIEAIVKFLYKSVKSFTENIPADTSHEDA